MRNGEQGCLVSCSGANWMEARAGRRIRADATLDQMRQRTQARYAQLPKAMTMLETDPPYPVVISAASQALPDQLDAERARYADRQIKGAHG